MKIKCEKCLNSRAIVSENGIHYICCFSDKKAIDCLISKKDSFVQNPVKKEN